MRALYAIAIAVLLSPQARAAVELGYGILPGEVAWEFHASPIESTDKTESLSQGMIFLGVESMWRLTDPFAAGFVLRIGFPAEKYAFDKSREFLPEYSDRNLGDSVTASMTALSSLARLSYSAAAGPGRFSLNLGLGAVFVGAEFETVDVWWWNGVYVTPTKADTIVFTETNNEVDLVALLALEASPGYSLRITPRDSVGIRFPLALLGNAKGQPAKLDLKRSFPDYPFDVSPSFKVGGFSYGVSVVYMREL